MVMATALLIYHTSLLVSQDEPRVVRHHYNMHLKGSGINLDIETWPHVDNYTSRGVTVSWSAFLGTCAPMAYLCKEQTPEAPAVAEAGRHGCNTHSSCW